MTFDNASEHESALLCYRGLVRYDTSLLDGCSQIRIDPPIEALIPKIRLELEKIHYLPDCQIVLA
jgi:hypothetical protein